MTSIQGKVMSVFLRFRFRLKRDSYICGFFPVFYFVCVLINASHISMIDRSEKTRRSKKTAWRPLLTLPPGKPLVDDSLGERKGSSVKGWKSVCWVGLLFSEDKSMVTEQQRPNWKDGNSVRNTIKTLTIEFASTDKDEVRGDDTRETQIKRDDRVYSGGRWTLD